MADNGGLYLSPDFSDFGDQGAAEIAALIEHYASASPDAKVFVACGSMGGYLCWKPRRQRHHRQAIERPAAARLGDRREFQGHARLQEEDARSSSAMAAMTSCSPIDKQEAFFRSLARDQGRLPHALRALRDRHARHADPHDRLARHAELDAVGGKIGCVRSTARCRDRSPSAGPSPRSGSDRPRSGPA